MAWTVLADSLFTVGKPGKGSIFKSLRDNITALANADAGSPPIVFAAIQAGMAGVTVGSVGTYALLYNTVSETVVAGTTRAGSQLLYASAGTSAGAYVSGTWRCMGYSDTATTDSRTTLWLRIS